MTIRVVCCTLDRLPTPHVKSTLHNCYQCNAPIWVADSTKEALKEHHPDETVSLNCQACAKPDSGVGAWPETLREVRRWVADNWLRP